jgi:DNA-binding GntR family transcriptional regulator
MPLGQRWTAADHVHEVLEQMVIAGQLKPGDRLTELSLAAQLQVSRTPLRQALQRLVSKGWIERSPNGAIYVVDVSEEEIEALYAVRTALEEMVLCQAAKRLLPENLKELREILSNQERAAKARNAELVSTYGEKFHRRLWELSHNHVGVRFLEEILQRTTRYRRLSFSEPYRFREGLKQHLQLVAAIERADLNEACRILREHINESRNYVLQAFRIWRQADSKPLARGSAQPTRTPSVGRKQKVHGVKPKTASQIRSR